MCVAIPMQIVALSGARAEIELAGNRREADVSLIDDPCAGDWVLVHAGFAIEKLDPEDAAETLEMFAGLEEGIGGGPES
jgi:hydrogenase expression/formation protein HypC